MNNKLSCTVEVKKNGRKVKNSCVRHVTLLERQNQGLHVIVALQSKNFELTGHGSGRYKDSFVADIDYSKNSADRHEVNKKYDTSIVLQMRIKGFDQDKYLMISSLGKSELHLYFFDKKKTKTKFVGYKKLIATKKKKK